MLKWVLMGVVAVVAMLRLRPVLMTVLTTLLGLSPLLFAQGFGKSWDPFGPHKQVRGRVAWVHKVKLVSLPPPRKATK